MIFTITDKFGIKLYSKKMQSNIYGCIKINGDTKQEYGYEYPKSNSCTFISILFV